jgi:hypothetical protein
LILGGWQGDYQWLLILVILQKEAKGKMKKQDLSEWIARVVASTLLEMTEKTTKLYRPKTRHIDKYRKSKLHPDEVEKQKRLKAIQQKNTSDEYNEPAYAVAPNVKVFLNTTLEAIPQTDITTKILRGIPVTKHEAMIAARTMMNLPGFPFQQPRKLMNMIVLLSLENSKG